MVIRAKQEPVHPGQRQSKRTYWDLFGRAWTSYPFFFTLQNEVTPNHANVTVKQIAITTRPDPTRPAWYFAYSCANATPPRPAIARKTNPVTSSQSRCRTRPNDRAVVRTAAVIARIVRLRSACCPAKRPATRATIPSFRAAETLLTASILSVSGATMAQPVAERTVSLRLASKTKGAGCP